MTAPPRSVLVPVDRFEAIAHTAGVAESAHTLMTTGRLTRVTVGRADFYPLAEILAAARKPVDPAWVHVLTEIHGSAR